MAIRQDAESDRSAAAAGQASEPEEGANRALRSIQWGLFSGERDYPLPDATKGILDDFGPLATRVSRDFHSEGRAHETNRWMRFRTGETITDSLDLRLSLSICDGAGPSTGSMGHLTLHYANQSYSRLSFAQRQTRQGPRAAHFPRHDQQRMGAVARRVPKRSCAPCRAAARC